MNTKRQVPFSLLDHYTFGIDLYFMEHEGEQPPADLEIFRRDAEETRRQAVANGELDDLRAAIDFVLAHDEAYLETNFGFLALAEIIQSENMQPEEVLKPILVFYRSVIWPDEGPIPPGGPPEVEMVKMPLEEWRRARNAEKA